METYGIELLDEGDWTAERLGQALAGDLARAQTEEGKSDRMLQSSLAGVLEIWSQQVLASILEGRFEALGVFSREISTLFARFPKLPMGRDLQPLERAGSQLEMLLSQIQCVQALPARSRLEALFAKDVRGAELRSQIVHCLYEEPGGLSTPSLMAKTGASRQTLHLALQKLREHGMVVSDPLAPIHHHTLNAAGRQLWERIRPGIKWPLAAAAAAAAVGAVGGYLAGHAGAAEANSPKPVVTVRRHKQTPPRPAPTLTP